MPSKYNENLGKKYPAPFIDNSDVLPPHLSELEQLKQMIRVSEKDIENGIGDKEILMRNILSYKKRIAEIESTIKKEPLGKTSFEPRNSSTWKKIDFSGRTPYEPPGAVKVIKPWWKFW
jgi:hypothetical protein